MNNNEIALKYGINRSTVGRWRESGVLATKLKELSVAPYVAQHVATSKSVAENVVSINSKFGKPNWQCNKNPITKKPYKSKMEALLTACAMVLEQFKESITLGGEIVSFKRGLDAHTSRLAHMNTIRAGRLPAINEGALIDGEQMFTATRVHARTYTEA